MADSFALFDVASHTYGLHLDTVLEFLRLPSTVPLPKAPPIIEGVFNLRGCLVPVLDLRKRFSLPAKAPHPADYLVVARTGQRMVAFRVDHVRGIETVDPSLMEDASAISSRTEYLAGVIKLPDDIVLIHDLATFLTAAEALEIDEALSCSKGESSCR